MTQLDDVLFGLTSLEGVEHLLLVGSDGLLVRHVGDATALEVERAAAMVPGVVQACATLGSATASGEPATAVVEFADRVAVVAVLSHELQLAVLVRPNVGFAPLLRLLRQERGRLASLL